MEPQAKDQIIYLEDLAWRVAGASGMSGSPANPIHTHEFNILQTVNDFCGYFVVTIPQAFIGTIDDHTKASAAGTTKEAALHNLAEILSYTTIFKMHRDGSLLSTDGTVYRTGSVKVKDSEAEAE